MGLVVTTQPMLFCMQAITSLDKHVAAPMNIMEEPAALKRLLQADNASNWSTLNTVETPGKPLNSDVETPDGVRVFMNYTKPYCAGGTSSIGTNVCDATGSTLDENGYLELTINKAAERHWVVTNAEFNELCEKPSERMAAVLRRKAYEIKMEINAAVIAEMYAIINAYKDGTNGKGANTKTATIINQDGNIIPAGMVKIDREYMQAGYNGKKLIFGGTSLADYYLTKAYQGGGANMTGTGDPFANMPFIYDNSFDSVFQTLEGDTNSHGLSMALGGLFVKEHYRNVDYNKVNLPNRLATTMLIDGMEFDYDMYFDECALTWKIQIKKRYGFASIPAAAYCNSQGLNFHWIFECGTMDCSKL